MRISSASSTLLSTVFNEEIIKYLDTFTRLLGPSELRKLAAQGANIYRGALVPEVDDSPRPQPREGEGVRMYRGAPLPGSESAVKAAAKANAEEKPAEQKPKKVYRGRVIED